MAKSTGKLTAELYGAAELYKQLSKILPAQAMKGIRKGLRDGAKEIHHDAKANVPASTGKLKQSLKVRAGKRRKNTARVNVLTGENESMFQGSTYYGGMVEYGTSKMAAQPFMRPAFENKKYAALAKIQRAIEAAIERSRGMA